MALLVAYKGYQKAELMAILVAVVFVRFPQRIISDHLNHVVALRDWMLNGNTPFLSSEYPNVDIWRRLHAAILKRGGLCEEEGYYFTVIWQPSHTRAKLSETQDMKHLRRGNAAADYFANLGRGLHPSVTDLVIATQSRYQTFKNWIFWVGKAADLQYDKNFGLCDHDAKDKTITKTKPIDQRVRIPIEARVIRRMPWAKWSLGTVEYTQDLWNQDPDLTVCENNDPVVRSAASMAASAREGSLVIRSYTERFRVELPVSRSRKERLIPIPNYSEYDEPLPTDLALGHHMMTCGLGKEQYFWCELCSAYSGDRVRKLAKECDRTSRNIPFVNKLRESIHPKLGTPLTTTARRMLKADIGTLLPLLDPSPSMLGEDGLARSDGWCQDLRAGVAGVLNCPPPLHSEG